MTMDAVTKEKLLESLIILKKDKIVIDDSKALNCTNNINSESSANLESPTLMFENSSNIVLSTNPESIPSFTDLSFPDLEIFSPFISDDEFDDIEMKTKSTDNNKTYFSNILDLFHKIETFSILISENQYMILANVSEKTPKFLFEFYLWTNLIGYINISQTVIHEKSLESKSDSIVIPEFTVQIFLPFQMIDIDNRISESNFNYDCFLADDQWLCIQIENVFQIQDQHKTVFAVTYDQFSESIIESINNLLENINYTSKIIINQMEKTDVIYYDNYFNENCGIKERYLNYLNSNFNENLLNCLATIQKLKIFKCNLQRMRNTSLSHGKRIHLRKKRSNHKELTPSNKNHLLLDQKRNMGDKKKISLNSIGNLIKTSSSQTKKGLSNLMTNSQSFLSHCIIHNKYLDYLFEKLLDNILNIIKLNTKSYLLLKYEIILSKECKFLSRDFSELTLSSRSSKDNAFYEACKNSEKNRNKRLSNMKENIINSQIKGSSVRVQSNSSLFNIQPIKRSSERLNSEDGNNKPNIFTIIKMKQQNVFTIKNDFKYKTAIHSSHINFRSVSVSSINQRNIRNRKSTSMDQTHLPLSKNDLTKRIDVFLKENFKGNYKNSTMKNTIPK